MAHANARQWQRFSYDADMQLRWGEGASERRVPSAQCIDVSRAGLQVRADEAPDVGAAVSCELSCAGAWTALPGRVRWRSTLASSACAGIEFERLSDAQQDFVQGLLKRIGKAGQTVQLSLSALREPLAALAVPTERGICLRAPLSVVRPGSDLDFELFDPPSMFAGRVVSARLFSEDGAEPWELEVLVEERSAPRSRRYTLYQTEPASDRPSSAGRRSTLHGAVQPSAAERAQPESTHERVRRPIVASAPRALSPSAAESLQPTAAAASARTGRADMPASASRLQLAGAARLQPSAANDEALPAIPKAWGPRVTTRLLGLLLVAALAGELAQLQWPSALRSELASLHWPVPAALRALFVSAPDPEAASVKTETRAPDTAPEPAQTSPQPPQPLAAETPRPAASPPAPVKPAGVSLGASDVGVDPTVKATGDTSEIFVPMRGSLTGMRAAIWVEPSALVIDLPEAKPALARSRYELKQGGIKLLTVVETHGVTQLRLFADELLARYSTEPTTGGLLIRVQHDLHPLR